MSGGSIEALCTFREVHFAGLLSAQNSGEPSPVHNTSVRPSTAKCLRSSIVIWKQWGKELLTKRKKYAFYIEDVPVICAKVAGSEYV